jgi:hypothetical protein
MCRTVGKKNEDFTNGAIGTRMLPPRRYANYYAARHRH